MTREDLVRDFLRPLQYDHRGPGTRSPRGLRGGKKRNDITGALDGGILGLYRIFHLLAVNTTTSTLVSVIYFMQNKINF